MVLKIFGSEKGESSLSEGEYLEVNSFSDKPETKMMRTLSGRVGIRVDRLNDFEDTDRVLKALREGNIIFLKIKSLKEKDMAELKRAIDKLKKTTLANNGDIAGVEQDWLIITPSHAGVVRG